MRYIMPYSAPECEDISAVPAFFVCVSFVEPEEGSLEGFTEEDWVV